MSVSVSELWEKTHTHAPETLIFIMCDALCHPLFYSFSLKKKKKCGSTTPELILWSTHGL